MQCVTILPMRSKALFRSFGTRQITIKNAPVPRFPAVAACTCRQEHQFRSMSPRTAVDRAVAVGRAVAGGRAGGRSIARSVDRAVAVGRATPAAGELSSRSEGTLLAQRGKKAIRVPWIEDPRRAWLQSSKEPRKSLPRGELRGPEPKLRESSSGSARSIFDPRHPNVLEPNAV